MASWTADEDASGYVYKIGATGEVQNATGTSVTLKNGETIYVKALGDGETTLDSSWSGGKKYVYVKPDEEKPGENPENPGETPENPDDGNKPSVDPEMEGVYTGSGEKSGCGSIAGAISGAMTMLVAGLVVALKRRGE